MHYVIIEPYRGLVKDCTVPGCDNPPVFVATLDSSTAPGDKQVACRSHVGDIAGNQIKRAVPA